MNNPPAFPCHLDTPSEYDGMTLRDYFAAKAMEKLMEKKHDSIFKILKKSYEHDDAIEMSQLMVVDMAYGWADAMLKAREA
jgi:hypothetical protein